MRGAGVSGGWGERSEREGLRAVPLPPVTPRWRTHAAMTLSEPQASTPWGGGGSQDPGGR